MMPRVKCTLCCDWMSSSSRYNDMPDDYPHVCHICRQQGPEDSMRCTALNSKGERCRKWKDYKSERCKTHRGKDDA